MVGKKEIYRLDITFHLQVLTPLFVQFMHFESYTTIKVSLSLKLFPSFEIFMKNAPVGLPREFDGLPSTVTGILRSRQLISRKLRS